MTQVQSVANATTINKIKLNWRAPNCDGKFVHGSKDCILIEITGKYMCSCINKPKNIDYEANYSLAQAVFVKKLHLDHSGEAWERAILELFTIGKFKNYIQIQSKTLKERFFNTMIPEVSNRHALGDSAGRESHPDVSPYGDLMLKMIQDIEKNKALKQ